MEVWLSWQNNAERLRLPILTSSFEIGVGNLNNRVNINEIGNINLIGKSDLREMSIESFFPAQEYSFCEYIGFPSPYDCIEMIERWRKSGKPIRLIITETPINIAFAIERFSYGEQDGSGDVYFTLELAEYIFTGLKAEPKKDDKDEYVKTETRTDSKEIPKTYTVKSGDTLSTIAKKLTGNSANYKKIAEKNNIKDPNKIYPGMELKL